MTAEANRYNVPGLERGLRILQLFDRRRPVLGAPEIAKQLDIPRSTAFRLLQTLEHLGFVEREGNEYRIGAAVLRLGFEYLASLDIVDLARPIVDKLRDESGYGAQLVIRDGREVVVVLKASSNNTFASNVQVGTRMPAQGTVYGRVLLFDLSMAELRALFPERQLPPASQRSPKTLAQLEQMLREDRGRGYAVSEGFFEPTISAVAAPVRDQSGAVVAAIGVALQQASIEPKLRERLVRLVLQSAQALSHRLNHRPVQAA